MWRPLALLFVLLFAPCVVAQEERASGQELRDGVLFDHDYSFSLHRPGSRWDLRVEKQIKSLVPDAVAGMVRSPQPYLVVIVERIAMEDVTDYSDILIEGLALEDKQVLDRELIKFSGLDAERFRVRGKTQGLSVEFLYTNFLREGFAFQVLAWSLVDGDGADPALLEAANAFHILQPDPVGRVQENTGVRNADGVGWRLRAGVFESANYGFRLGEVQGWRVLVGDELRLLSPDAEIGYHHQQTESYVIFILEKAAGVVRDDFLAGLRQGVALDLGVTASARSLVFETAGTRREYQLLEPGHSNPLPLSYLYDAWFEEDICLQVLAWRASAIEQAEGDPFATVFGALEFLSPAELERLHAELAGLSASQDYVGRESSLRDGVFRDFANDFEWVIPQTGLWTVLAGQAAREQNEDARLAFESKVSGLFGELIVEHDVGLDSAEYHEAALALMGFDGASASGDEPERVMLGEVEARTSLFDTEEEGMLLRWHVTTCMWGDHALQIVLWGARDNLTRTQELAKAVRAGLRLHPSGLEATRRTGARYIDDRMGYELHFERGTHVRDVTSDKVSAISSEVALKRAAHGMRVFAVWFPLQAGDEESLRRLAHDAVLRVCNGVHPSSSDDRVYEEGTAQLSGRAAKRLRFEAGGRRYEALYVIVGSRLIGAITERSKRRGMDIEETLRLR